MKDNLAVAGGSREGVSGMRSSACEMWKCTACVFLITMEMTDSRPCQTEVEGTPSDTPQLS